MKPMGPFGIVRALHLDGFFFNDPPKAHVEYARSVAMDMVADITQVVGIQFACGKCGAMHDPNENRSTMSPTETKSDRINHPSHYNAHPSGVECITVVEHMTFNVGNAIKYLWRAGLKDASPMLEDLRKAR